MTWKNDMLLNETKLVAKEKYTQYPNIDKKKIQPWLVWLSALSSGL